MTDTGKPRVKLSNSVFWAVIAAVAVYFIAQHFGVFRNVITVLVGFGAVVLVHEFGHFIVAKLSGIKVEAFSIGMPPTLLGIRKAPDGFKIRVLPALAPKGEQPEEPPEETEYRIGLLPLGGFVKLLGQEDTGPVKQVDDPRSFANKPVGARIAVISAGVVFNVISGALIFMVVFLAGIKLAAPVVGGIAANSPAAEAGLRPGDEVIEIDGMHKDLDFSNIVIASALSDKGEPIPVVVRHQDGTTERKELVAKDSSGTQLREFGIYQAYSLTIAPVENTKLLEERTKLRPGDVIVAADSTEVAHSWDLDAVIRRTFTPMVKMTAERQTTGGSEKIQTELPVVWPAAKNGEIRTDADLSEVYSMVPRLRVAGIDASPKAKGRNGTNPGSALQPDDIIVEAGGVSNPTYREMREKTKEYEGKPLAITVLRADANGVEQTLAITVTPKLDRTTNRVVIGFTPALDAQHPVVAATLSEPNAATGVQIPRGARIVSVNDKPVSSFYDVVSEIQRSTSPEVALRYQVDGQAEAVATLKTGQRAVGLEPRLAESVPFPVLERLYRAHGPINALGMGYRRTVMFIAQTYVTLKQLLTGLISPKFLMGPVGIISLSYRIVEEQPLINYLYFLGLISATIAVLNFLPIPPFDGGLVVLMIIEKIRGVALSERAQGFVAYAGWIMVLALLVYVTFNDLMRTFSS